MDIKEFEQQKIPIVEIFNSISGEGISSGEIVTFVRVAGCNLRCSYCDTKYSYDECSEENEYLTPSVIVNRLEELGCKNIICTGGEPLELDKGKRYLPLYLSTKGFKVRIETNGSCPLYSNEDIEKFTNQKKLMNVNYTLDIKSPSSGMNKHNLKDNLGMLRRGDEVKFVVASKEDINYGMDIIDNYKNTLSKNNVIINFSPIFDEIEPSKLVDIIKERYQYFQRNNLKVRVSLQIHKYIWPPEARGV